MFMRERFLAVVVISVGVIWVLAYRFSGLSSCQDTCGSGTGVDLVNGDRVTFQKNHVLNIWYKRDDFYAYENAVCWLNEFLQPSTVGMYVKLHLIDSGTNLTQSLMSTHGHHIFAIKGYAVEYEHLKSTFRQLPTSLGLPGYGVLCFNDEEGHLNSERSHHEYVMAVLRPYFFPKIYNDSRYAWIPTCYLPGRGPLNVDHLLRASLRQTTCWYAGSNRTRRHELAVAMKGLDSPCEISVTESYKKGLPPIEYQLMLQNIVFAPCPAGNSPETHRLYEAWEAGAIPVMLESEMNLGYFNVIHANAPILNASSWVHARDQMVALMQDPNQLDELQKKNIQYYQHLKMNIANDVGSHIRRTFVKNSAVAIQ